MKGGGRNDCYTNRTATICTLGVHGSISIAQQKWCSVTIFARRLVERDRRSTDNNLSRSTMRSLHAWPLRIESGKGLQFSERCSAVSGDSVSQK